MEPLVSEIKSKRVQQKRLQQELEQLEQTCHEQVRAEAVAELKRQVPELQSIEATEAIGGWGRFTVAYKVTLASGVTFNDGLHALGVSFNGETFSLAHFAMSNPKYVFKHKLKATRIAVNKAVAVWKRLEPLLQRVAPSEVKRQCVGLLEAE